MGEKTRHSADRRVSWGVHLGHSKVGGCMIVHRQEHSSRWLLEGSKCNLSSKHPGTTMVCEWLQSLQEEDIPLGWLCNA